MKKFTYLALVLSLGLFTIGCEKPKDVPKADPAKMDGKMDDKSGDPKGDDKMEEKDAPVETK